MRVVALASLCAALCLGLLTSSPARAAYPDKPVLAVVPFGAGGGNDILLRLIAKYAEPALGQALVVDNKPGAGGQIGWTLVAKAKPDGYTLTASALPSMILVKELRQNVPFELSDFIFICNIQSDPIVWLVPEDSKFKTAQELADYAKANPGKLNVAGDGPQSNVQLQHLLAEKQLGLKTNFVSYNGSGPALTALLGSKVDLAAATLSSAVPHIEGKRLRPLVLFNETPLLEGVLTANQAFGVEIPSVGSSLRGLAAPKGTPDAIIAKLEESFKAITASPEFLEQAKGLGLHIEFLDRKAMTELVQKTTAIVEANKALFE